jgi:cytochrome b subunit of formate dehydrogenase
MAGNHWSMVIIMIIIIISGAINKLYYSIAFGDMLHEGFMYYSNFPPHVCD